MVTEVKPEGFSSVLKNSTNEQHRIVGTSTVMKKLMEKTISKQEYILLLSRYYFMYKSLEDLTYKHANNTYVKLLYFPEQLNRVKSLEEDLAFYLGEEFQKNEILASPSESVKAFTEHLNATAEKDPGLLICHMYVRYMGDLFGGQMMSNKLERAFDLKESKGIKFYKFEGIPKIMEFVKKLKDNLDTITDEEMQKKIIEETTSAYELNYDILCEVDNLL